MAGRVSGGQLIIPNENLGIHQKKPFVDGKTAKSFGTASTKKGGLATGTRKALNDITNKSTIHHEASSKKTALPKEEFNEAEEKFLHDHKKCIEAQRNALNAFQLEMVLPGIDVCCNAEKAQSKQKKSEHDLESPRCYREPAELPMSEFSDWFESSTQWISPPCSPLKLDSPPSSPFTWQFGTVEFVLREDN
ncbi:protein PATRONUS 2 [Ziziphus jujuba]|uniref:Protein PATRONUS 2 n=1 Tax=Ziziphus jujuba TaxID=326968 RepID=A0A6P3Z8K6_ZIZJJ|nr:protein PATRONUS 2 [Ziziphus jujuba]XP_048323768.2 protein PATRONUS 2 [Ziziphus jujuba]